MKTFPTLEKLVKVAVKGGHNEIDALTTIGKSYNYLARFYSETSASLLVEIAYSIY